MAGPGNPSQYTFTLSRLPSYDAVPPSDPSAPSLSFPTSYLGESFQVHAVLQNHDASAVLMLRVYIQTPSQHHISLAESTTKPEESPDDPSTIPPLELSLSHDIKELGIYSVICLVSYVHPATSDYPFQQVYFLNAVNPLSVKTKALASQSLDSQLAAPQNQTSYLEVQVSNATQAVLSLKSLEFQPVPGLIAVDATPLEALQSLAPHDLYKLLFIVSPNPEGENSPPLPVDNAITLGSLNLSWSIPSTGQQGKLQTSTLVRKIQSGGAGNLSSAASPSSASPRPSLSSSFQNLSPSSPIRKSVSQQSFVHADSHLDPSDVALSLSIDEIYPGTVKVGEPFCIRYKISLSRHAAAPPQPYASSSSPSGTPVSSPAPRIKQRPRTGKILLSAQHIRLHADLQRHVVEEEVARAIATNPEKELPQTPGAEGEEDDFTDVTPIVRRVSYPPPYPTSSISYNPRQKATPSMSVLQLGSSLVHMDDVDFDISSSTETDQKPSTEKPGEEGECNAARTFSMEYLALEKGIVRVGGIRILAIRSPKPLQPGPNATRVLPPVEAVVMKEVDIAAEVTVT